MTKISDSINDVAFESLTSDPTNPPNGDPRFYFNSSTKELRVFDGANWKNVDTSASLELTNVRNSEGSGTTTLTVSDLNAQAFNLSADRTVVLPTTSIQKGETWVMEERTGAFTLSVQSSDASPLTSVKGGKATFLALVNAPVAETDWYISSEPIKVYRNSSTGNFGVSNTYAFTDTVVLPPGRYLVTSVYEINLNGAYDAIETTINTSATASSDRPEKIVRGNYLLYDGVNFLGNISIPNAYFDLTSTTTLYFGIFGKYSGSAPSYSHSYIAVKI